MTNAEIAAMHAEEMAIMYAEAAARRAGDIFVLSVVGDPDVGLRTHQAESHAKAAMHYLVKVQK